MDSSRLFVNAGWAADRYQGERPQITMSWQITEQGCVSCHLHPRAYERMKQRAKDGPIKWPTEDTWYNLDHPEKSMMLLAPLSEEAGGLGICDDIPGITQSAPVFHSKNDPRWQQLRADMKATAATFREITTFERPGFIPSPHYIREMKRAGALPRDWQPGDPIDLFEVERRYLQKWWPKGRPRAEAN
jgi:hypothetical protein